jgi:hypothetical protein
VDGGALGTVRVLWLSYGAANWRLACRVGLGSSSGSRRSAHHLRCSIVREDPAVTDSLSRSTTERHAAPEQVRSAVPLERRAPERAGGAGAGPSRYNRVSRGDDISTTGTFAWAMAEAARFLNEPAEDVDTVLGRLAAVAYQAIPAVDMASISVATRQGISTKAATAQPARDLDRLQYSWQEGPCVDALLDPDKSEVVVDDMGHELRWPRSTARAAPSREG